MELILINSSKLKIMLSGDDMKKYDLDTDMIDYDTTATRRAFWSILDDAKCETGFNAADDRVFIQLYPSKKGGCEMYVTKLGTVSKEGRTSGGDRKGDIHVIPADRRDSSRDRRGAYAFETMEALLCVCRRLLHLDFEGKSHAYRDDSGRFYLILHRHGYGYASLDEFSFINEYGTTENADRLMLYISEHAQCICESTAIATLGIL